MELSTPIEGVLRFFYNALGDVIEVNIFYFPNQIQSYSLLSDHGSEWRDFFVKDVIVLTEKSD